MNGYELENAYKDDYEYFKEKQIVCCCGAYFFGNYHGPGGLRLGRI